MRVRTAAESPEARERRRVRGPVLAFTGTAWLATVVLMSAPSGATPPVAHSGGMVMGGPADTQMMSAMSAHVGGASLLGFAGIWSLMLAAMMTPLLIGPLRHIGERSLPRRRPRAWALFLAVYAALWVVGGFVLLGIAETLDRTEAAVWVALAVAALWQVTPVKQRCLNLHHAGPPLAAFGRRADLDVLRFGGTHALWCIGSCWALMLLPLLVVRGQTAVMAAVTLWIWAEQFDLPVAAAWHFRVPLRALSIIGASAALPFARNGLSSSPVTR